MRLGKQHPDRDGQFRHIHSRILARRRKREPSISVDTKKKEVLGNLKNAGKSYRPKGKPIEVDVHDFPNPELGKAVPYGVYDIGENEALVSVGIRHDMRNSRWSRSGGGGCGWAASVTEKPVGCW